MLKKSKFDYVNVKIQLLLNNFMIQNQAAAIEISIARNTNMFWLKYGICPFVFYGFLTVGGGGRNCRFPLLHQQKDKQNCPRSTWRGFNRQISSWKTIYPISISIIPFVTVTGSRNLITIQIKGGRVYAATLNRLSAGNWVYTAPHMGAFIGVGVKTAVIVMDYQDFHGQVPFQPDSPNGYC